MLNSMTLKKDVYLVEGMSCQGCENAVQRMVRSVPGVEEAKADLSSSTLSVTYDSGRATVDQLKEAVQRVGYKLVGERPPAGQRESSDEAIS